MSKDMEVILGSTVMERISTVRMSETERQAALSAMHAASVLVDAWFWMWQRVSRVLSLRAVEQR